MADSEMQMRLAVRIKSLMKADQILLGLRWQEGLTVSEVAQVLERPEDSIRAELDNLYRKLFKGLEGEETYDTKDIQTIHH